MPIGQWQRDPAGRLSRIRPAQGSKSGSPITTSGCSPRWWEPCLLSVIVRPQPVPRLTLARKGWLVVGVPVVFQLILLALLFLMQRAHDREVSETRRSRELTSSSYRVLGLLTDAETG